MYILIVVDVSEWEREREREGGREGGRESVCEKKTHSGGGRAPTTVGWPHPPTCVSLYRSFSAVSC